MNTVTHLYSHFLSDEDGAVTVDFVVIVGAICTLGLVVVTAIGSGTTDLANSTENFIGNVPDEVGL